MSEITLVRKWNWPSPGMLLLDVTGLGIGLLAWNGAPLLGASCIAIVALALVAQARPPREEPSLVLDAEGIRVLGWGEGNGLRWAELVEVGILTTSDGPFAEDVFWILVGAEGGGGVVPGRIAAPLLERLQRLPRFDNEAVVAAMGSTSEARFRIWQGAAGEALAAS